MTYSEVILYLVPTAQFAIAGDDYASLQWVAPGSAPTEQQIIDAQSSAGLAAAQTAKNTELQNACAAAIGAGVSSNALGSNHHYPLLLTDQINLAGVLLESIFSFDTDPSRTFPFWCYDGATWDRRLHTHTQMRQVGLHVAPFVRGHQDHLRDLRNQVAAATTVAQVNAITW